MILFLLVTISVCFILWTYKPKAVHTKLETAIITAITFESGKYLVTLNSRLFRSITINNQLLYSRYSVGESLHLEVTNEPMPKPIAVYTEHGVQRPINVISMILN